MAAFLLTAPLAAQEAAPPPVSVLTIDPQRLFEETAYGRRVQRDLETMASALAQENRRIEAELIAEERDLTERRAALPIEEFRALADAFDTKVEQIRAEQDSKALNLQRRQEAERQRFFGQIGAVLSDIVRERRAAVVLDQRNVFIAAESVDVTDETIARVDEQIGAGESLEDLPEDP